MFASWMKLILFLAFAYEGLCGTGCLFASAQQARRPFTVADDIQFAVFAGSSGTDEGLVFSPDGSYFVVETERGRLDLNRPEGSLRFYRSQDVEGFLNGSKQSQPPLPIWVVDRSTDQEGRILKKWRWLPDSSGVVFLERTPATDNDSYRLVLADLRQRKAGPLTAALEAVDQFDVRDRQHYVYTAANSSSKREAISTGHKGLAFVGTGRSLNQLLLPDDPSTAQYYSHRTFSLWAVINGRRFEVKQGEAPLTPQGGLALSPDGRSVVTALPVSDVPPSWETLYPPPFASDPYRIRAGHSSAHQYAEINLQTGSLRSLTDAPISNRAGLWAWTHSAPDWSSDGHSILLPGTFLKSKDNLPSRPCVAVVDVISNTRTCVEMLKGETEKGVEEGFHNIQDSRFAGGNKHRVVIRFYGYPDHTQIVTTEYELAPDGVWHVLTTTDANRVPNVGHSDLEVTIKGGLNEPPVVVGTNRQKSRIIWDPNPQLERVELGQASVYTWTDKEDRNWRGVLFRPHQYKPGQRYPLVIQTHGFTESQFIPSGGFPTAFAARALAAVGFAVLQVSESALCPVASPQEGLCAVGGYKAAVDQLVLEGLVDPERIGIIGFSRSCFYVMKALTTGSLRLKAASITDGVMETYLEYMLSSGDGNRVANEANSIIGAPPFGDGLQQWLKRSPGFNLDKVNAPLLVVALGPNGVLRMWEPYAGLRFLPKPVDLIMLNTDEHVLTNPAVRMASQGGSVDWFRFWLQGYEDPDPKKSDQYARWRELRKLQEQNEAKNGATNPH